MKIAHKSPKNLKPLGSFLASLSLSGALSASALAVDTDTDGLEDEWETLHFSDLSQDGQGDPDGDGYLNSTEEEFGMDPNVSGGFPGYLSHDVWYDIPGTSADDLINSEKFYQSPDLQQFILGSEISLDSDDSGSRLRGTLTAPISGSFTFWVSGDDGVQLWISSNESKFSRQLVAWHDGSTGIQEWDLSPTQKSAPISLQAGQKYYLELLHKEGGGSAHASIAWSYEADDLTNLASSANAVATQSSTLYDGEASRAIDGNRNGRYSGASVTHTDREPGNWWQVDFGSEKQIQKIVIYNRTDRRAAPRLSNFRVSVLDGIGGEVFGRDYHTDEGYVDGSLMIELEAPVNGRVVKVALLGNNLKGDGALTLAEVEVMSSLSGVPSETPLGYLTNWTQEPSVSASQSTTAYGGEASRAIDGNRSGKYGEGSVTHTDNLEGSWWQVDLGEERPVNRVVIYNRTNSAQNRLSNFRVVLLDASDVELSHRDFYVDEGYAPYQSQWDVPAATNAQKVRIESLGPNRRGDHILSFAEVEVLGSQTLLAGEIQGRELIPIGALESYVADPTDPDDDYMPTAWEVSNGFDPNSASNGADGPFSDPDGDLIANWLECRLGSDPNVPNGWPGALTEEVWTGVAGETLAELYQNPKFLQTPAIRRFIETSEGTRFLGNKTGSRIRGYLTAPETGDYSFWLSGDDQVKFWMSPDDQKFNKELLIAPHLYVGYQEYDVELSQKSKVLSLVAGQKYYLEFQGKEAGGGGASPASLAWLPPGGERSLIPIEHLSSYGGDLNDQDDDELPDDWEIANGLNPSDNGAIDPSQGNQGDLDGDGLTNVEEHVAGTRADLGDTDGDGVSDYDEVIVLQTNSLVGDVAPFQLEQTLNGSDFVDHDGSWKTDESRGYGDSVRGWADYQIVVPKNGVYLLTLEASPRVLAELSSDYEFLLSIDGHIHERVSITVSDGEIGTVSSLSSWLQQGIHTVRIFNDNALTARRVNIESLSVLSAQGSDASGNGVPDWVEYQLSLSNAIDTQHTTSRVSPAVIEGRARFFETMTLSGGLVASPLANDAWSVDLPLSENAAETLQADFENGGTSASLSVVWEPTNLLLESALSVRLNDSLRLTAFTGTSANGSDKVWLTLAGTTYDFKGKDPMVWQFNTAGTHLIDIVHRRGNGNNASEITHQVTVEVIAPTNVSSPVMMPTHFREWVVPALPAGAILEFDERTIVNESVPLLDGSTRYILTTGTPETRYAHVRLGVEGPILQSIPIRGLTVRDAEHTSVRFVKSFRDGSYQVDMPVVISSVYPDVYVHYDIFLAGVIFDTGGIEKDYLASDFDAFGQALVSFIKTGTDGSACHRTSVYHNGVRIGHFF